MARPVRYILCFLLLSFSSEAQSLSDISPILDSRNGLVQDKVNCLAIDSTGFLWVGTETGLFRYDGYRLIPFLKDLENQNSISNNRIRSLAVDSAGCIWIGTAEGLNHYNPLTERMNRFYASEEEHELKSNDIRALYFDKTGRLWVGTQGGGLSELWTYSSDGSISFINHSPEEGSMALNAGEINSLVEDDIGRLWIGTDSGLFSLLLYDDESDPDQPALFSLFELNDGGQIISSEEWRISDMIFHKGLLWVADQSGVNRIKLTYDEGSEADYQYYSEFPEEDASALDGPINAFLITSEKQLVAGSDQGLYVYDDASQSFLPGVNKELPVYLPVLDFIVDRNGNTLVASSKMGVYAMPSNSKILIEDEENLLESEVVSAIYWEEEKWIGTYGNGLFRIRGKEKTLYNSQSHSIFKDDLISGIYEYPEGKLLISTYGESPLIQYDPSTDKFGVEKSIGTRIPGEIRQMKFTESGIWVSTLSQGLFFLAENTIDDLNFHPSSSSWMKVSDEACNDIELVNDLVLVATDEQGVDVITLGKKEVRNISHIPGKVNSLASNVINSITYWKDLKFWIGTSGGLDLLDLSADTVNISHFGLSQGIPSDLVYESFVLEDSALVFSTSNGLAVLDFKSMIVKTPSDAAFANREFVFASSYRSADSNIFFGSINGLVSYANLNGHGNSSGLVHFTELRIEGRLITNESLLDDKLDVLDSSILQASKIKLNHLHDDFSISFSDLNFLKKSQRFEYRLFPREKNWSSTNSSSVNYADLPSGEYTFEVGLSSGSADGPDSVSSIKVQVSAAPWFSKLAYAIYAALALFLLYVLYRLLRSRFKLRRTLDLEKIEREKIEELNTLRNRLFTNISHEFRTPLTLIIAPLEKLIQDSSGEKTDSLVSIRKNAQRLLDLINQLLDLSKAESGYMQVYSRPLNLNLFLEQIVSKHREGLKNKDIDFKANLPMEPLWLQTDPEKLEVIISNLMSNVRKYCPDGGEAFLRFAYLSDRMEFSVFNSGPQIVPGDEEKIFDRYYRMDQGKLLSEPGTGIGLALARELAQLLGGSIWYERPAEGGNLFRVSIPALKAEDHQRTSQFDELPEGNQEARILLVEDNPEILELLKSIIPSHYERLEAKNGQEGFDAAKEHIPDLIISDVMMPVMDGVEMLRKLRADMLTSHIPLIFLTAKADEDSRLDGLRSGADSYLSKPFSTEELLILIKNQLDRLESLKVRLGKGPAADLDRLPSMDQQFLMKLRTCIEENLSDEDFGVNEIAEQMGMSRVHLNRKLRAIADSSPSSLLRDMRLEKASGIIASKSATISEAAYNSGFSNLSYFTKLFKEKYGVIPSEFADARKV